jgi:alkylation response protein AidB-like acyl-CoA dehydrogenase
MEEIAKVDASAAVVMSVNNSLVCAGLEKFASEEQKQKYLVPLAKGEVIGAFVFLSQKLVLMLLPKKLLQ